MKKVIGIDLDGTLAQFTEWKGPAVIGDPLPDASYFLQELVNNDWMVCIWTTRAKPFVWQWLNKHGLTRYISMVNESPYPCDDHKRSFDVYIGDEAVRFDGDYHKALSTIHQIGRARHWGEDSFDRDVREADRNPSLMMYGTGKLYLDYYDKYTGLAWAEHMRHQELKPHALLTICSHAKPYGKSWIHGEIRRRLFEAGVLQLVDIVHVSSAGVLPSTAQLYLPELCHYDWNGAEITEEDVKTALREKIVERIKAWWQIAGSTYESISIYLRPSGNTRAAVLQAFEELGVQVFVINVNEFPSPPWSEYPDVDDCLADPRNLGLIDRGNGEMTNRRNWDGSITVTAEIKQ